jgi:xanthine dehydrogenase YagS FAD-binding subunit
LLKGQKFDDALAERVADGAFSGAKPAKGNAFKVALGKRMVARALRQAVTMEI